MDVRWYRQDRAAVLAALRHDRWHGRKRRATVVPADVAPRAPPSRETMLNHSEVWGYAWDAWWAERVGRAAIRARQRDRLADLVRLARARSPLYRERYRHLPADLELHDLPPV